MPRGRPSTEARTCGQKPGCQKLLARIPALDTLPTAHQQTCLVRKRAFNVLTVVIVKKLAATPKAPRKDIRPTVLPLDQLKRFGVIIMPPHGSQEKILASGCDATY